MTTALESQLTKTNPKQRYSSEFQEQEFSNRPEKILLIHEYSPTLHISQNFKELKATENVRRSKNIVRAPASRASASSKKAEENRNGSNLIAQKSKV